MPKYLQQFTYSNEALGESIKHPQNRAEMISELFGRLGGKVEFFYFGLGGFDVVGIAEFPDNETLTAITNAVRATAAERNHKITILLTREEAIMALRRAGSTGYQPPSEPVRRLKVASYDKINPTQRLAALPAVV